MNPTLLQFIFLVVGMLGLTCQLSAENILFRDDTLEKRTRQYQYREALDHIEQLLQQPADMDAAKKMYYLSRKSRIHHKLIQADEAVHEAQNALQLFPLVRDSLRWAEAAMAMAHASNMQGNLTLSATLAKQVLAYTQKHPNPENNRDALIVLGTISLQNSQFQQAMQLYRQAKSISKTHQLSHHLHVDDLLIGSVFMFNQQPDSALFFLNMAATRAQQVGDLAVLAGAYATMATCYQITQSMPPWKTYILKAIDIAGEIGHASLLFNCYSQLLEYEMAQGNPTGAIQHGLKAKDYLKNNPLPLFEVYVDSLLYMAFKSTGDTDKALAFFESYFQNKTRILNEDQAASIGKLSLELELNEKNLQLARADKRLFISIMGYFALFTGLFVGFLIRWWKQRNRNQSYQKEKIIAQLIRQKDQALINNTISDVRMPDEDLPLDSHEPVETFSEEHKELYDNMIHVIESKKLYLNPKLDKNVVITLLGTNRFYLFQALNKHADVPFRDIINRYRIEEAKRLIQQECAKGEVNNNPQLYADAGFNSSSTYYRTFKQHTGLTPLEYAREYLNDMQAKP
jgi:AraC-like DNA-binding protein